MKERPIIFSIDMVKAILEDNKTQTRRVVKPQPCEWVETIRYDNENNLCVFYGIEAGMSTSTTTFRGQPPISCPYGKVGDRLWVRETYRIDSFMPGEPLRFGYKDGTVEEENDSIGTPEYEDWLDRATEQSTVDAEKAFKKGLVTQDEEGFYRWDKQKSPCRWRPSIFMPRWASRITLEITDIRVERLQKISYGDILNEGRPINEHLGNAGETAKVWFKELWNSLHKKGNHWEDNPWVWVVSFKKLNHSQ